MKYKIYCNNKEYKVPSATVYGYGDVIPIVFGEDVAVRLWDGDIAYLKKDYADNGDDYALYFSLESGYCSSVFYINPIDGWIDQSAYGWICSGDTFQEYGHFLRIYKFGEYEDIYDTEIGDNVYAEDSCRKHGTLVGILQFTTNVNGEEVWRFLDPTIVQYNGQWLELPTMRERLFISSFAQTRDGDGYYYLFESGTEGLGLIKDRDSTNVYAESYRGWFGDGYPAADRELYIYHCGDLYDFMDYHNADYPDNFFDFDGLNSYFANYNIQPTILRYNEDTELWYLVQEGTRYDY